MLPAPCVVIIGASVRAAAMSALRAGLQPWCADLFADADLRKLCTAVRLRSRYPRGVIEVLRHATPAPLIYTGGIENHPAIVAALGERRTLWGNDARALKRARSPRKLVALLRRHGLCFPLLGSGTRSAVRRLVKPLRGAGGAGIRFWEGETLARSGTYLQQFIEGNPGSAIFIAEDDSAELLGITRQLVGCPWLHGGRFQYAGSIGPWRLTRVETETIRRIGATVASEFRLRGLFGVDFIRSAEGIYPVEVNPRYPASTEVLELATGTSALASHAAVFAPGQLPLPEPRRGRAQQGIVGKAILYACKDVTFPASGPWSATLVKPWRPWQVPAFADIPLPGENIGAGQPVFTFFARADSVGSCLSRLRDRAGTLIRILFPKKSQNFPENA